MIIKKGVIVAKFYAKKYKWTLSIKVLVFIYIWWSVGMHADVLKIDYCRLPDYFSLISDTNFQDVLSFTGQSLGFIIIIILLKKISDNILKKIILSQNFYLILKKIF